MEIIVKAHSPCQVVRVALENMLSMKSDCPFNFHLFVIVKKCRRLFSKRTKLVVQLSKYMHQSMQNDLSAKFWLLNYKICE